MTVEQSKQVEGAYFNLETMGVHSLVGWSAVVQVPTLLPVLFSMIIKTFISISKNAKCRFDDKRDPFEEQKCFEIMVNNTGFSLICGLFFQFVTYTIPNCGLVLNYYQTTN